MMANMHPFIVPSSPVLRTDRGLQGESSVPQFEQRISDRGCFPPPFFGRGLEQRGGRGGGERLASFPVGMHARGSSIQVAETMHLSKAPEI